MPLPLCVAEYRTELSPLGGLSPIQSIQSLPAPVREQRRGGSAGAEPLHWPSGRGVGKQATNEGKGTIGRAERAKSQDCQEDFNVDMCDSCSIHLIIL